MSQYDSELHRFVIGETRVDGFKSQWLLDWEQYLADEAAKRKIKSAKPVKVRAPRPVKVKAPKPPKPPKPEPRHCSECPATILDRNKTGLCALHYWKKKYAMENGESRKCSKCDRNIQRDNALGLCKFDSHKYYQQKHRDKIRAERLALAA